MAGLRSSNAASEEEFKYLILIISRETTFSPSDQIFDSSISSISTLSKPPELVQLLIMLHLADSILDTRLDFGSFKAYGDS